MSQLMNCKCNVKYKELSKIKMKHFQRIKMIFISSYKTAEVIFVNKSDDVYGYGSNWCGRLGFGNDAPVKKPTIIPELCGKGVKNVLFGSSFTVTLTESMDVYIFGFDFQYFKPQKLNLNGKLVIDIKCCAYSTFLLTKTNEVYYCLGYDRFSGPAILSPTLLNFNYKKIIDISCGFQHTLALTDTGKVYSWGHNSDGQLGLGNTKAKDTPRLIKFSDDIFVKSISCGCNHSLLLTSDSKVYTFGLNDCQQLGTGDTTNQTSPQLIETNVRFTEIFAVQHTSMALNETNSIVIWGELRDGNKSRIQTNCNSFQEAIDTFCKRTYFYKPISAKEGFRKKSKSPVIDTMSRMFNNQSFSDLKFKIKRKNTAEFDYIYAQKWFIANSSEYFQRMFANEWSEASKNEITVTNYSYTAYYQYVRCLYIDDIDAEDVELLIELLGITDEHLNDEMKTKCVERIIEFMDIDNVCSVYSSSLTYRSTELEDFSFELMSENVKLIVKTDDFQNVDPNHIRHFFTKFYENH